MLVRLARQLLTGLDVVTAVYLDKRATLGAFFGDLPTLQCNAFRGILRSNSTATICTHMICRADEAVRLLGLVGEYHMFIESHGSALQPSVALFIRMLPEYHDQVFTGASLA